MSQDFYTNVQLVGNNILVRGVENGKRNVSIININKITTALDTSLADFFNSDIF